MVVRLQTLEVSGSECALRMKMLALLIAFAETTTFVVNADLVLKPSDTEAVVGDSTYFDCASNVNSNEINWYHYAVGAKDHEDICIYCLGKIHPQYEKRILLETHNSTGNFRLKFKSLQLNDAGKYLCEDNEGLGQSASAQLVVLESSPSCTSNVHPDGLLGPNSCNIDPEKLHLSCSVAYKGNMPPIIQWRETNTVDPVDKGLSCQNTGNRMTCNLTMNTDLGLHGSSYICDTNRSATIQYNCTSNVIRIIYAKSDNSTKEAINGLGEKVSCSVNSSQECSYTWKWVDGVDEEIASNDSVLTPWKIGWHKCEASCNIRGKQCTVLSRRVHVVESTTTSCSLKLLWSLLTCTTIMDIILIIVLIRLIRLRQKFSSSRKHSPPPLLIADDFTYNSKTKTGQLEAVRLSTTDTNEKAIEGFAILKENAFV